jgi:hypothetical protein
VSEVFAGDVWAGVGVGLDWDPAGKGGRGFQPCRFSGGAILEGRFYFQRWGYWTVFLGCKWGFVSLVELGFLKNKFLFPVDEVFFIASFFHTVDKKFAVIRTGFDYT